MYNQAAYFNRVTPGLALYVVDTISWFLITDLRATLSLWQCAVSCIQAPVTNSYNTNTNPIYLSFKTDHQLTNF